MNSDEDLLAGRCSRCQQASLSAFDQVEAHLLRLPNRFSSRGSTEIFPTALVQCYLKHANEEIISQIIPAPHMPSLILPHFQQPCWQDSTDRPFVTPWKSSYLASMVSMADIARHLQATPQLPPKLCSCGRSYIQKYLLSSETRVLNPLQGGCRNGLPFNEEREFIPGGTRQIMA